MDKLIRKVRENVLGQMDLSRDMSDNEIVDLIAQEISLVAKGRQLSIKERIYIEKQVFNSLRKLDAIQELIDDPTVTEIMVNGPRHIFYEKEGRIWQWDGCFPSEERLLDVLQQVVARHNRVVNMSSPIVDTRLEDGSRVNMVLSPLSLDGSALTIRKFPKDPLTMAQLIIMESISEEAAELLQLFVKAKYNLMISGGTGSGKTTFLNALSHYIPSEERIITIEDSAELQIQGIPNLVRLETRNANMEGVAAITVRDLIKTALRMRPDRIIVGECRGGEAFDMLSACNTGHDGSMSTGHANSSKDILSRLETMVLMGMELPLLAIRQQIEAGIDIIVHLGRLRDRSRRILEITEIDKMENGEIILNPLFEFKETGEVDGRVLGKLQRKGELHHRQKLVFAGVSLEEWEEKYFGL